MRKLINIVISDRGWILEKLASELTSRLSYVRYSSEPDPSSPIQYYNTYGCRKARISPVEIALFTHLEQDAAAASRFFDTAKTIDFAIAMSNATGKILKDAGVENLRIILPGVDIERFKPKLKIAVVGRTYHTGRKGEALVNAVMDIPDIEWSFTGDGWPGPAIHVPEEELPAFYRSVDYVLVPATIEGGPMCVLEALASGVEVIGPPVGWVADFPHIPFETGDANSLRSVLLGLLEKRATLAESVAGVTWDRWAEEHDQVFQTLIQRLPDDHKTTVDVPPQKRIRTAALVLHGGSEKIALGGPTVRVPATAAALASEGIAAKVVQFTSQGFQPFDLVHGFNIWEPSTAKELARQAAKFGKPFVFSPILLDLSDLRLWRELILEVFVSSNDPDEIDARIWDYHAEFEENKVRGLLPDPIGGYRDSLKEIAQSADAFIYLSEKEQKLAESFGARANFSSVIRNPVNVELFSSSDPTLFKAAYGLDDYVLCVGRIEQRKNQLLLAHALRDTGLTLVLIGHVTDPDYGNLLKTIPGINVLSVGRLDPYSPMLRSALAGARVFTLPSFTEGAPLAALEAGACGLRMVLSDRSGEQEYFGDLARYCTPSNPTSIREAILEAWENEWTDEQAHSLQQHVAQNFSWERYARETAALYDTVAERRGKGLLPEGVIRRAKRISSTPLLPSDPLEIVFDVTTTLNHHATLRSGIVRVERSVSLALLENPGVKVRFVAWGPGMQFYEVPEEIVKSGLIKSYVASCKLNASIPTPFTNGIPFVVLGSGWMQNGSFAQGISQFARHHGLHLSILIHDLTPTLFPFWFQRGYEGNFTKNFKTILRTADRLLVYSDNTRRDILNFALVNNIDVGSIDKIRLADAIDADNTLLSSAQFDRDKEIRATFSEVKFALAIGGIHTRKNYGLLFDIWVLLREKLKDDCPHLVVVGGISWNGEDTARAMSEDARVKDFIHILDGIEDLTLDWLYRNCICTVYPSLYEGWGLPVGESLSYGKVCIATNTSSVPEIAPDLTDLIDPLDRTAWTARVLLYVTSKTAREAREALIRQNYKSTHWADTAKALISALALPAQKPDAALYNLGTIIELNAQSESAIDFKYGGWHDNEGWGSWAHDPNPSIRLQLTTEVTTNLLFSAVVRIFSQKGSIGYCAVVVNGTKVASWTLNEGAYVLRSAIIPSELIGPDNRLDIVFRSSGVVRVKTLDTKSTDARSLGLGMTSFVLESATTITSVSPTLVPATKDFLPAGKWLMPAEMRPAVSTGQMGDPAWGLLSSEGRIAIRLTSCLKALCGAEENAGVKLQAIVRGPAISTDPVNILLLVNGTKIGVWTLPSVEPVLCEVLIPSAIIGNSDPFDLLMLSQTSRSVEEAGAGFNKTRFSFSILRLMLEPVAPPQPYKEIPVLPIGEPVSPNEGPLTRGVPVWSAIRDGSWYDEERSGVWSIGSLGRLRFKVDAEETSELAIWLQAIRLSSEKAEEVEIEINGRKAGAFLFEPGIAGQLKHSYALLPLGISEASDPTLNIAFKPTLPSSPFLATRSIDERSIGIFLRKIQIHRLPHIEARHVINFADPDIESRLVLVNWYAPEINETEAWRWSQGGSGTVYLRAQTEEDLGIDLVLKIAVSFATTEKPKIVEIIVNGLSLAEKVLTQKVSQTAVVRVPADAIALSPILELRLVQRDPLRLADIEANSDRRSLGVQLMDIGVWPIGAYVVTDDESESDGSSTGPETESIRRQAELGLPLEIMAADEVSEQSAVLLENWHVPEEGKYRWSIGSSGYVKVYLADADLKGGFTCTATVCVPVATASSPRTIEVLVEGRAMAEATLLDNLATPLSFVVPEDVTRECTPIEIQFRQESPFCPLDLGISSDDRLLGLQLYSLSLEALIKEQAIESHTEQWPTVLLQGNIAELTEPIMLDNDQPVLTLDDAVVPDVKNGPLEEFSAPRNGNVPVDETEIRLEPDGLDAPDNLAETTAIDVMTSGEPQSEARG